MFALARRILGCDDAARDVVHDVFARLLDAGVANVTRAYLLSAVRNRCLNVLRDMDVHSRFALLASVETGDAERDEDLLGRIRTLVDSMPAELTRKVVLMRYAAGMGYNEIAEELAISRAGVFRHLRHAIEYLRENLDEYGQP